MIDNGAIVVQAQESGDALRKPDSILSTCIYLSALVLLTARRKTNNHTSRYSSLDQQLECAPYLRAQGSRDNDDYPADKAY